MDHIIPCISFDLTKEEEQRKCFHYTNLRPLWAVDNLKRPKK
jgi:ribosomal protein L40E